MLLFRLKGEILIKAEKVCLRKIFLLVKKTRIYTGKRSINNYFCLKNTWIGTPSKSKFSRSLFSIKRL